MKYFIKIISVLTLFILTTSFSEKDKNKLKTGFYYLTEIESEAELINDVDSEDLFAVDKREILTVSDLSKAKFVLRNFQPNPIKVIELKLTKDGRKKWAEIKNKISTTGESIVFICNNKVYLEKRIAGKGNLENSTIDLFIESKYQEAVFQVINSEINNSR